MIIAVKLTSQIELLMHITSCSQHKKINSKSQNNIYSSNRRTNNSYIYKSQIVQHQTLTLVRMMQQRQQQQNHRVQLCVVHNETTCQKMHNVSITYKLQIITIQMAKVTL